MDMHLHLNQDALKSKPTLIQPLQPTSHRDYTFRAWLEEYGTIKEGCDSSYLSSILGSIHGIVTSLPFDEYGLVLLCKQEAMYKELEQYIFKCSSNRNKRISYFLK